MKLFVSSTSNNSAVRLQEEDAPDSGRPVQPGRPPQARGLDRGSPTRASVRLNTSPVRGGMLLGQMQTRMGRRLFVLALELLDAIPDDEEKKIEIDVDGRTLVITEETTNGIL